MDYMGINIDLSRDELFDNLGLLRLKESYMMDNETSPQQRFAYVSNQFGSNLEHSQRMYDYASKHWVSFATPILSFGKSKKGLPISCFLVYMNDTSEGLVNTLSETNWLSMMGGGVGIGVGIRSADEKSTGIMPHLKIYDASCQAYRQGTTRRGSYATYLDISHPDIQMFIEMRKPTGDPNIRCLNLHNAVNITDDFMQIIEKCMIDPSADDSWPLIDPHSKAVKEVVSAKLLWQSILETRMMTGEPYIHFIDRSNEFLPHFQKKLGLKVTQSNLCVAGDSLITILLEDETILDINIEDLEKYLKQGLVKIYSYNEKTKQFEFKPITNFALMNSSAKIMKITDDLGHELKCTPDHKIYTRNRGYVFAKDLAETDELLFDD